MKKPLIIVGLALGLSILISVLLIASAGQKESPKQVDQAQASDLTKGPALGPADAKVTLTEFGDFQCPACAQFAPIVRELGKSFPTQLRIVFKHFPLSQHKNAPASAEAAAAAADQGKFWEMYDLIYAQQTAWENLPDPVPTFVGYAQELGLDPAKFEQQVRGNAFAKVIEADTNLGFKLNVQATPTFFVNRQQIKTPVNLDAFKQVIQSQLAG